MDNVVEIRNYSLKRGSFALKDVNLNVKRGESFAVLEKQAPEKRCCWNPLPDTTVTEAAIYS